MTDAVRNDYGSVAKTLHWVTVILVIIAWALGIFGEGLSARSTQESGLLTHSIAPAAAALRSCPGSADIGV